MGPASAYATVLAAVNKDIESLLETNPEIFDFSSANSGIIDTRDFQTTGVVSGAAAFSAVLREWTEAAVIFTIVIVNAVIGIVQEKKAQSSLEALKNMSAPTAIVLCQGEESIVPASELVIGDVVMVSDGSLIPADKLQIIKSLKRTGEVAAMTGDGVNDSPALKAADIGVAMGITGTDVAKEAADMILLDDSFTTIAYAIKEGRRVYRNIQKVIQFLLVGNIAEILTLLLATLFNWDVPLLAVHILWVNLATATLPALALGVDPASKNIMKHQPVKTGTLFERDLVFRVITQGIFVAAMTTCAYWIGTGTGGHAAGQTMAFGVLAFSQMLRAFNQRSNTEPIWVRAEGINPWLILSFAASAVLMACILFVPALQRAFSLTTLEGGQWLAVFGLSLLSIVQVEAGKILKKAVEKR